MNNQNLDKWYEGRCHAPGMPVEEETEVIDTTAGTAFAHEELDLDLAYNKLEAIKKSLIVLRGKLLITPEAEIQIPSEEASFLTPKLQQLLQLRHTNSGLKSRFQKMLQHLQHTRRELKSVDAMRCQLNFRLNEMTDKLDKFNEFQSKAKHYFGLCIERNEQIKACKLDDKQFAEQMKVVVLHTESRMQHLVPMRCHNQLHYEISVELALIRILLHSVFSNMMNDWNQCAKRLTQHNWRCSTILSPVDNSKCRD